MFWVDENAIRFVVGGCLVSPIIVPVLAGVQANDETCLLLTRRSRLGHLSSRMRNANISSDDCTESFD